MKTRNIYEVAALLSCGATVVKVDREDKQHQEFTLCYDGEEEHPKLREFQLGFQSDTLMVNASKFAEAIRKMKSIIHS
jgi:hypothetical protein